ncbi:putative MreB/Mbl protein [Nitrospina gracilis 3/211]|uniref:Putative MreB/Mbl protein n=1 Tax=Nitrospina gracilis (strain 3/211) TaxID=1266370 RepID=M1YXJ9_NITG3|nr:MULTISPECIES: type IV pilus assembly protein PilM [Nitrospina]MCF8723151.1 type IV pilus assembly protein PilM [Nitrospina sp. Nb-3]CCQ90195.1 putative MreB/Mbl protein [Nitrospina gracilis 3/211]
MFLSAKTPLLAIDIGSHSIKVAQLDGDPGKFELKNFGLMPLEPESVTEGVVRDEEQVSDALTRLLAAEKINNRFAVVSVSGEAVMIKKIKVPVLPEEDLAEAIQEEAEQYIPFDIDDVRIDYQVLEPSVTFDEHEFEDEEEEKLDILLVAVQNEIIDSRLAVLAAAGLKPVIVDLDVFAIVNALGNSRNVKDMGSVALLDLGHTFTHLNILMDGVSTFTRDIPVGGGLCTKNLVSRFQLEPKDAEALKYGVLPEEVEKDDVINVILDSIDPIIEELHKAFEFFSSTSNSQVEKVFVMGGGALIPGVDGFIADRMAVPVELFDPFESIKIPSTFDKKALAHMAPMSAVAIGLASRRFDYLEQMESKKKEQKVK